jgi:diguanylate cyclase (GGDEF)-like protein
MSEPVDIEAPEIGVSRGPTAVRSRSAQPAESAETTASSSAVVTGILRGLLRIRSAGHAAQVLQEAVRELGGSVAPAAEAGPDALPIDLSLGEGPPVLATAEPMSVARMQLERILPRLVEDARHAVDLLRYAERLEVDANRDQLTGLANRRVLKRLLPRVESGVVIMMDLDHFKAVNDTFGHAAGDAVLADFGQLLTNQVRVGDTICRVGGEEFVIVAERSDEPTALKLIERLRSIWAESTSRPITFSAGVAAVGDAGSAAALVAADGALYRAKRNGRNRTEVAPPLTEPDDAR